MTARTLFRLSGLSLLLALVTQIVGWLMYPSSERLVDLLSPLHGPSDLVLFVSWLFVLLGLPGLYAWQSSRAGVLGLLGFVTTIFAAAYHCYLLVYEAYPAVWLARNTATQDLIAPDGPLAHGAEALGPLASAAILAFPLLGIATVRAGVLPRWAGWAQIACVPVSFVCMMLLPDTMMEGLPGPIQPIALLYYLLFVGYAGGGYTLWAMVEQTHESLIQSDIQQLAV